MMAKHCKMKFFTLFSFVYVLHIAMTLMPEIFSVMKGRGEYKRHIREEVLRRNKKGGAFHALPDSEIYTSEYFIHYFAHAFISLAHNPCHNHKSGVLSTHPS